MKESYELNKINEELHGIKQELRIQNMLSILKLTMRTYGSRDIVKILAKIEENPDKKFNELVNEIFNQYLWEYL